MRLLPRVSSSSLRALGLAPLGWALLSLGCGRDNEAASLRALLPAGEISLLCMGKGPDGRFTEGLPRSACPDYEGRARGDEERHLMALVTQPAAGEVALVDLAVGVNPVVDFEPTQPGYSFLPVGAEPTSIVSSPGGLASFVGVRETGREGIFGLPTSCVGPRPDGGALRDLRTWPACRLPAAPGPMVLLNDAAVADAGGSLATQVRERCSADYVDADDLIGTAPAATRELCPVDLAEEAAPLGRRKLAVSLPSFGEIWVLDAQELLDRTPGSFEDCVPETQLLLSLEPATQRERLPADLAPSSASCAPVGFDQGPDSTGIRPWPADIALDENATLYIADSQAPQIHRLDGSDPCSLPVLPALHPQSYSNPAALITTRKLAVSSLTPQGKRYVYAVDNSTTTTAGSLIPFDVSPGSTERTPIVRERASFTPAEPPDRILLPRDVADVEFVFRDVAEPNLGNNIAIEGIACDPDPRLPFEDAAALYRPRSDRSFGARPTKLRGTFAFAALHSGQLAVVDVEDLDAACRRPVTANAAPVEDLNGCRNDDPLFEFTGFEIIPGAPTVSDELSCNLVVPHRARSRSFFSNGYGTARSAGLIAFPSLILANARSVATDQSEEGREQPKLLGARHFANESATLYVGPLPYSTADSGDRLEFDPGLAERSSVLLSYQEPRAYVPQEDFAATYEGVVRAQSQAIFRAPEPGSSLGSVDEGQNASFCNSGIQDVDLTAEVGRTLQLSDPEQLARFASLHADYVQITGSLLADDDPYWLASDTGAQCGAELFQGGGDSATELQGRPLCDRFFGPADVPTGNRDLRIVEASEDRLSVEPRDYAQSSPERRRQLMEFVSCCFPEQTSFVVRAGRQWVIRGGATGMGHHVTTDAVSRRCVNDCDPLTQRRTGRVFEISCTENCRDAEGRLPAGPAVRNEDFVCVVDNTSGGIDPGEPGSECVFQSTTTRLAIYRGQQPTKRDTRFRWLLSDGFAPLTLSLATDRSVSSPRSLLTLPELGQLLITDGTAAGVVQVQLSNLATASIY